MWWLSHCKLEDTEVLENWLKKNAHTNAWMAGRKKEGTVMAWS